MSCTLMQSLFFDSVVELQFPAFTSGELVTISPTLNILNIFFHRENKHYQPFIVPSGSYGLTRSLV